MTSPIAVSLGLSIAGMMTKKPIAMRKTNGTTIFTRIGLGISGFVRLSQSMPTIEAPTESQSV